MSQPKWKLAGELGDVGCPDYTGVFVFVDETGVYAPEIELVDPLFDDDEWDDYQERINEHDPADGDFYTDDEECRVEVRRGCCDACTFIDGILSDNRYHPDHAAWFADDVDSICSSIGADRDEWIESICSDDPMRRASCWNDIAGHWGWDNLDSYPFHINYAEATDRVASHRKAV